MSTSDGLVADAEGDLAVAFLEALRAAPDVPDELGTPPRIFDDETRGAAYPYAVLERHETEASGASLVDGQLHRITLAIYSRHGGRSEAKTLLGALRRAGESVSLTLSGQRVVLVVAVYSDVLLAPDLRRFRSLIRFKIITEEA